MTDRLAATARAHPNIAFIKYWGNRDDRLRLPANSSLSMNLSGIYTQTTVTWSSTLDQDQLVLNQRTEFGPALNRVIAHLDQLRQRYGIQGRAVVETVNNFPMGAGIASSAAAFAALTLAATAAAGIHLSERELTTLARLGSGSAARSIPAGYVEWRAGDTHDTSFAESVAPPEHWPLFDIIAVVSAEHKRVGSQDGHRSAVTSDLQPARVAGAERRLQQCKEAVLSRDFGAFAEIVELDSNLMHAVMMTSNPPLFYWLPATLAVMDSVRRWRAEGLRVCYTLDAGPNVHCICAPEDAGQIEEWVRQIPGVQALHICGVGGAAQIVNDDDLNT